MNLRILKKLSKRAAAHLPALGDRREPFKAEKDDSYTGLLIMSRKHWERGRSVHADTLSEREIKTPAKDGRGWVYAHPPVHPRKGTIMVGAVSGYYEPEWDETTAWEALLDIVYAHFTDYPADGLGDCVLTRPLDTPGEVFQAASELRARLSRSPTQ